MPSLHWESKNPPTPIQAELETDSFVFPGGCGYPLVEPENLLIHGDNLAIMWALLEKYEGRVDLIYADPPFFTNRHFPARIGRGEDSRKPQDWKLAEGYPDAWPDLDAYLDMLYPRLVLMHRLLAPTGSLYLHLDWHADAYARLLLDEIFGADRLLNEIIWVYHGPSPIRTAFNRKHDTILVYTKSKDYTFNVDAVRQPYDPNTVKTFNSSPKAGFGKVPNLKRGKVPEDWWYFPVVARLHKERTGYPTQKPEALLERVILASSNPGDLVADFFGGSGTLPAVSERSGRRFLASDVTWRAIHTTRARLTAQTPGTPFRLLRLKGTPPPPARASGSLQLLKRKGEAYLVWDGQADLPEKLLAEIDYWEIDPDWNGKVFRSVVQAGRTRSGEPVPAQLPLPENPSGHLRARLTLVSGEQIELDA